jgi:DNA end-binding protein Ku
MARAIWSGSISFGLVNVPVKAFSAVRDHSVHFNQLEKGTGARIHYKKVSDKSGKEVSGDHIESGYEISSGKCPRPTSTRSPMGGPSRRPRS